jgi:hypothetical protein
MQEGITPIRRHVRRVTGIPIEVTLDFNHSYHAENETISDVSQGGLCFIAGDRLEINESLQVRFPALKRIHGLNGKVVWCNKIAEGYAVGLEFDDPGEVERLKMIDQICQIESFRQGLEKSEGRKLSGEQAAREWVSRYAGEFKGSEYAVARDE